MPPLTDYEKFVNTEALLACQRPFDTLVNSHELFFQVTHQMMELWMKVIAYELHVVVEVRSLRNVPASRLEHTSREPLFPELWAAINQVTKLGL